MTSGQRRWNKLDELWDARFTQLLKYKAKHGDCNVPQRQGSLGMWVCKQRKSYAADSISQDRVDRLDGIGFIWALRGRTLTGGKTVTWDTRFSELLKYKAEHGNYNVPARQDGGLGMWVCNQRRNYRADSLAQDRIDRLDGIGFTWALKECGKIVPWETRFKELLKYRAKRGDCNIPVRSKGGIGTWVSNQRRAYKDGELSQDRIDQLNSIGFNWALKKRVEQTERVRVPWETRFNQLVEYKAKHGDCNVPVRQGQLGQWVHKQRYTYKIGKLSKDRIDRLDGIGFHFGGIGFHWTSTVRGPRKTPIGARKQPLQSKTRTKIQSGSAEAELIGTKSETVKDESCDSGTRTAGNEEDDEEVGAMIYEEVMQRRQVLTRRRTRSSMKYH